MKKMLKNLGIGFLVGFLIGAAANISIAEDKQPAAQTWCEQWNTFGDEPGSVTTDNQRMMFHLGFFLTKSATLREMIQQNTKLDNQTMDKIMTCYEENIPQLVEAVDKACHLSDTSRQDPTVDRVINGYVNWCIAQSTKKA